jgi:hypothetical protein
MLRAVEVQELGATTTIHIHPRFRFLIGTFCLFVAYKLAVIGAKGWSHSTSPSGATGTSRMLYWLLASAPWALACVVLLAFALWSFLGRKVIAMSNSELNISWKLWPFAVFQSKTFELEKIGDIWLDERNNRRRGHTYRSYALVFDYMGKMEELYSPLTKDEGERLLAGPLKRFVRGAQ